jgi:ABC-type uncharacterized transport system substrate-binding protein
MQFGRLKRRKFTALLGSAMAAWPLAVRAQPGERVRRIDVLMAHDENDAEFKSYVASFRGGLEKLGWSEGRNVRIDFRWGALDDAEARQRSAHELITLGPDLILTQNTPPTASMLQQTRTIPVVFVIVADPVGSGFVESLARPGANATGFTVLEPTVSGKWVELLKEIAPRVKSGCRFIQSSNDALRQLLPKPIKGRGCVLQVASRRCTCSQCIRSRIRGRRPGPDAERRFGRDPGWIS